MMRSMMFLGGLVACSGPVDDQFHVQTADGRVIDLPEDLSRNIQKAVGPAVIRRIEQELGVRVSSISFSFSE